MGGSTVYEMKGDVMAKETLYTPRRKLIHNTIPTSLFLSRPQHTYRQFDFPNAFTTQSFKAGQRCRDGVYE